LAQLPRTTISNAESGAANPTLNVLVKLAQALKISLEEMLSPPRGECQIFKAGTLPTQERGRLGGAAVQKLLPHPIPGMEIDGTRTKVLDVVKQSVFL
jgi:transcriptional regulator with XRE-family HTH domain